MPVVIVGSVARLVVGAKEVCIGGASTGQGMAPQADLGNFARARRLLQTDSVEKLEWRSLGHICRGGQTIPWAAIVDPGSI